MIKEEHILNDNLGKSNHFKVPDGYFDQIAASVMAKLPEQESSAEGVSVNAHGAKARLIDIRSHALWQHLPLRQIAAAAAIVMLLGAGIWKLNTSTDDSQKHYASASLSPATQKATLKSSEEATFNQMADYTMMDNETIYASLIAEN